MPNECPYCNEKLPSPLPNKLKNLFIKFQGKRLDVVDEFEFCHIHIAETQIVPNGIKKGYLEVIDFDAIPDRIKKFKTDLLDICKKKVKSFYRENFMKIYCGIGNKANTAMGL